MLYMTHQKKTNPRFFVAEWHRKIESYGYYLEQAQADELLQLCDSCLVSYAILSKMAIEDGQLLFPIRPKLHVSWYL